MLPTRLRFFTSLLGGWLVSIHRSPALPALTARAAPPLPAPDALARWRHAPRRAVTASADPRVASVLRQIETTQPITFAYAGGEPRLLIPAVVFTVEAFPGFTLRHLRHRRRRAHLSL